MLKFSGQLINFFPFLYPFLHCFLDLKAKSCLLVYIV